MKRKLFLSVSNIYGLKELFIVALVGCFYYMVSIVLLGNPECLSC